MKKPTAFVPLATNSTLSFPSCEHLDYEIRMLFYTGEALLKADPKYSRYDLNALLESFAIHTRSLLDFFYGTRKKDDIIAADFFDPPSDWVSQRPGEMTLTHLKRAAMRANKEIVHLTMTRLTMVGTAKHWSVSDEMAEMRIILYAFDKHSSPVKVSAELRQSIQDVIVGKPVQVASPTSPGELLAISSSSPVQMSFTGPGQRREPFKRDE